MQLLKDTPDIDRHSKWGDVKHKIDTDPRYVAAGSDSRRERWFNEYKHNLDVSIIAIVENKKVWGQQRNGTFPVFVQKFTYELQYSQFVF